MQKFCHNCGKQLTVGAKFCTECGTSLASLDAKPSTSSKPSSVDSASQAGFTPFVVGRGEDDDDDSYLDRLTHAPLRQNELHVEIVKDRPLGETVGTVMSTSIRPDTDSLSRVAAPVSSEGILETFRQEAGTLRK